MPPSHRVVEKRLKALLRLWSVCFAAMAIALAVAPGKIVEVLNKVGTEWVRWPGPPANMPQDRFFVALSCSLLILLAILAHNAHQDLRRRLSAVRAILVSKFASSAYYAVAFFMDAHYFAYVAGIVVDGAIFVVTYYYYRRARHLI